MRFGETNTYFSTQWWLIISCVHIALDAGFPIVFNLTDIFPQNQNNAVPASRKQAIELTGGGVSSRRANLNWCQPLHFIPRAESRPIIALASFPGSGNTWLRYLLQQATGNTAYQTPILWHTLRLVDYNYCITLSSNKAIKMRRR